MSDLGKWLEEDPTSFQAAVLRSIKDTHAPPTLERQVLKALRLIGSTDLSLSASTDIAVARTTPKDLAISRAEPSRAEPSRAEPSRAEPCPKRRSQGVRCSEARTNRRWSKLPQVLSSAIAGAFVGAIGMYLAVGLPAVPMASGASTAVPGAPPPVEAVAQPKAPTAVLYPDLSVKRVTLVVMPADSLVEVEGVPVMNRNGIVEVVGTLDSVHQVRVSRFGKMITQDVAVTEAGASPPVLQLFGNQAR